MRRLALVDDEPLATSAERTAFADKQAAWETATAPVREQIAALEAPHRAKIMAEKRGYFPDYMQKIFDVPAAGRTPLEAQMVELASRQMVVESDDVAKRMDEAERHEHAACETVAKEHRAPPAPLPLATIRRDIRAAGPRHGDTGKNRGAINQVSSVCFRHRSRIYIRPAAAPGAAWALPAGWRAPKTH